MLIRFTKMQGAGNDFVVLDETQGEHGLSAAQYRYLADRRFGVGADQILSVRRATEAGVDFSYAIHNADGAEVEHCGNGARCFVRYVHDHGLSPANPLRVRVKKGLLSLRADAGGEVEVDMGPPWLAPADLPFDAQGLRAKALGAGQQWPLDLPGGKPLWIGLASMGNPHAVTLVPDTALAPVAQLGPLVTRHPRFAQGVNAGFMQILNRSEVRLRVFERGVGETLACGTGACAAVVMGIHWGLLDAQVAVHTLGGRLSIRWPAQRPPWPSVLMTGPAIRVFEGQLVLPSDAELLAQPMPQLPA